MKNKKLLTFESCDYLQRFCPGGTIASHLLQKYWQIITKIQVDYPTNHCQVRTGSSNAQCISVYFHKKRTEFMIIWITSKAVLLLVFQMIQITYKLNHQTTLKIIQWCYT